MFQLAVTTVLSRMHVASACLPEPQAQHLQEAELLLILRRQESVCRMAYRVREKPATILLTLSASMV